MTKLNLGCGKRKFDDFINVDISSKYNPNVLHDLNVFPYPFNDSEIDEIRVFHVLEHLNNPEDVMRECHRILKSNGSVIIKVPHFSRGFTNPNHKWGFDISWYLHFNIYNKYSTYAGCFFELEKIKLNWIAFLDYYPCSYFVKSILRFLNCLINFFANLSPSFCSRIWCFYVGGFEEIEFRFIAIKPL